MALNSIVRTFGDEGPLPKFVDAPTKYQCEACGDVARGPVQTLCGHHLCQFCVTDMLARTELGDEVKCPGGEVECVLITLETVFPDICTKKELEELKVRCKYESYGCQTVVKWKDLGKHEEKCPFAAVVCPNEGCDAMVRKDDLQQHVDKECLITPVVCPSCQQMVKQGFLRHHLKEECPAGTTPCPFKCGEQAIVRSGLEQHRQQCRSRPMACHYCTFGCNIQGNSQDIKEHMKTGIQHHLDLVTTRAADMSATIAQLQTTVEESANANELLKNQLAKLNEELLNQGKTVQSQTKKIAMLERCVAGQIQTVMELKDEMQAQTTKYEKSAQEVSKQQRHLQEMQQRHGRRLGDLETGLLVDGGGEGSESVKQQLVRHDQQLGVYDLRMSEMDLRFQCMETANYDGVLLWKICDYGRRKREAASGRTLSLYSQPFYTSRYGYRMCARVYLNGDGLGKGTHMSLFFVVMKGDYDMLLDWPFKQKVTMSLLDQSGGGRHLTDTFIPDPSSSSFQKPMSEMNVASGCPLFAAQSLAQNKPYMINDTIFIRVVIDIHLGSTNAASR